MQIEPDFQWTINPFNLLWSIGGAMIAGSALIWGWGRKWQTVESVNIRLTDELREVKKSIKENKDDIHENYKNTALELVRLHAELDVLRDEKAKYRIEAEGKFATREELAKQAELIGRIRERLPRQPYSGAG
jgi:cell shape-determining protein MreC